MALGEQENNLLGLENRLTSVTQRVLWSVGGTYHFPRKKNYLFFRNAAMLKNSARPLPVLMKLLKNFSNRIAMNEIEWRTRLPNYVIEVLVLHK